MGYPCANFSLPMPLCSRVRPDTRDRETSDRRLTDVRRQTKASLNASIIWGGDIINNTKLPGWATFEHLKRVKTVWRSGLRPGPCWELTALPRPPSWLPLPKSPTPLLVLRAEVSFVSVEKKILATALGVCRTAQKVLSAGIPLLGIGGVPGPLEIRPSRHLLPRLIWSFEVKRNERPLEKNGFLASRLSWSLRVIGSIGNL